jgi:acylphosphatase
LRVQGVGFRTFRVQGVGFRTLRVQGVGFSTFRVQGVGFRTFRVDTYEGIGVEGISIWCDVRIQGLDIWACRFEAHSRG